MENPHLFWVSKCGKTDRVPSLNSKRKTAQNRMVEPQIYGVPEKSKTFWGEEERRRERADDFLKRKSRRERYIVRDNDGWGRRTWSRLPARSVLLLTLYAEVSTGDPHPSTLSECLVFIFWEETTKKIFLSDYAERFKPSQYLKADFMI